MKWLGYPIYRLLFAYGLGIVIGYYCGLALSLCIWSVALSILVVIVSVFLSKRNRWLRFLFGISVGLFFAFLGAAYMTSKQPAYSQRHFKNYVTHERQLIRLVLNQQLHSNEYNNRFYADVVQLDSFATKGKVLVLFKKSDSVNYKIGNQLLVYDDISDASHERNPGDFNYKQYLELIDVYGQVYVDKKNVLQADAVQISWINQLREQLIHRLNASGLQPHSIAVIQALVLGQRNQLDIEITQSFRDAGVIHILALSGLHVGIILLILKFCTNWIKRWRHGHWIQSIVIIVFLWLFALLTGMSASILRAVTMFSFIAIGMNMRRKASIFHSLALSAFVLLLINPKLLFQVGFQLSYTAVLAIVLIHPILYHRLSSRWNVVNHFYNIAAVTLAAQIGVAPLSLYYFHQFPGLFLVSNMLLLPVLPLVIGMSILLLVLLIVNVPVQWLVTILDVMLQLMIDIIAQVSSWNQFIIKNVYLDRLDVFVIYVALLSVVLFFYKIAKRGRRERTLQPQSGYELHVALLSLILLLSFKSYKEYIPSDDRFVIMHQAAGSVISISNKDQAKLLVDFHAMDTVRFEKSLQRIQSSTLHRDKTVFVDSLQNKVSFDNKEIYIVDENGIVPQNTKAPILLLSHSPQIHLDKVITQLEPRIIIADGSNYRNYVNRWKVTCTNRGISFLSTYEVGAIDLSSLEVDARN